MILAVGGAAGGLGRFVARMGLLCRLADAEIISSIGDALRWYEPSRERTVAH